MSTVKCACQSEFARRHVAIGKAAGKEEGKAEGQVEALLAVLSARGLEVDDAARARIQSCTDLSELQTWITRAVSAPSVAAVFEPEAVVAAPAKKAKKSRR